MDTIQKRYISREEFWGHCDELISQIMSSGKTYKVIIVPIRGGMPIGYELVTALGDDVLVVGAQISSYHDEKKTTEPVFAEKSLAMAKVGLEGLTPEEILFVDDIYDSGETYHTFVSKFGKIDSAFLFQRWSKDTQHVTFASEVMDNDVWIVFPDEERTISGIEDSVRTMPRPHKVKKK